MTHIINNYNVNKNKNKRLVLFTIKKSEKKFTK